MSYSRSAILDFRLPILDYESLKIQIDVSNEQSKIQHLKSKMEMVQGVGFEPT
ncbi:MAG: hypothetical protein ACR2J3_05495 [Aridibacter sp.]